MTLDDTSLRPIRIGSTVVLGRALITLWWQALAEQDVLTDRFDNIVRALHNIAIDNKAFGHIIKEVDRIHFKSDGNLRRAVRLTRHRYMFGTASIGFIAGLGGWPLLLVTLPVSTASSILLNIRSGLAIALLHGKKLDNPELYIITKEILTSHLKVHAKKELTIHTAKELTAEASKHAGEIILPMIEITVEQICSEICKKAAEQIGQKTVSSLLIRYIRPVPIVGGVLGAAFECYETYHATKSVEMRFS